MFKKRSDQGFTLVEMLIVTVVFLIVIALGAQVIRLATLASQTNTNINEVEQSARVAMKFIERDITNSGNDFIEGTAATNVTPATTSGPFIATTAFLPIRGGSTANLPVATTPNAQPIYCLLPVNLRDDLGNGGGASPVQNGSSDRLTLGYKNEFLMAGTSQRFQDPAALTMPIDAAPIPIAEYHGTWDPVMKRVNLPTVPVLDAASGTYTRYILDSSQLKQGDIVEFKSNGASPTPAVLGMVTSVAPGFITLGTEALGFNTNQGLNPPMNNNFYPLDQLTPPYAPSLGQDYTITKVDLYTYFVNTTTKELIRRRYRYAAAGPTNAFIDDIICQNVERFRLTYNTITPGDSSATPPVLPILNTEVSIDPDTTLTDYAKLSNIRRVNVSLVLRSSNLDSRNKQPARYALNASFTPRNTAYVANEFAQ